MRVHFHVDDVSHKRLCEAAARRGVPLSMYAKHVTLNACADDLAPQAMELDPYARRSVETYAIVKTEGP